MEELVLEIQEIEPETIKSEPLKRMVELIQGNSELNIQAWEDTSWQQWRGDYSDMSPW
jgi:hypothetical protein